MVLLDISSHELACRLHFEIPACHQNIHVYDLTSLGIIEAGGQGHQRKFYPLITGSPAYFWVLMNLQATLSTHGSVV
jgi:hypothetical protein